MIALRVGRGQALAYMPPREATAARHNLELASWLVSEVDGVGTTWRLLLDGLDKVDVRPETFDFVVHLMRAAETTTRRLRVVLLGCEEPLPADLEDMSCGEQIETIERAKVEEFFRRLAEHKHIDVTDGHIEATVETVFANAPEDGSERLRALHGAAQGLPGVRRGPGGGRGLRRGACRARLDHRGPR